MEYSIQEMIDKLIEISNLCEDDLPENNDNQSKEVVLCDNLISSLEELQQFKDKEEQGLLIEIPLRVGDKFWELSWSNDSFYPRVAHSLSHVVYCMERLGKWCFLTESEAEEALANMKVE